MHAIGLKRKTARVTVNTAVKRQASARVLILTGRASISSAQYHQRGK